MTIIESAIGVVDEVNKVFGTSVAYRPGSLLVWLDGIELSGSDFSETSSSTFTLVSTPVLHSTICAMYASYGASYDASLVLLDVVLEVSDLTGTVR